MIKALVIISFVTASASMLRAQVELPDLYIYTYTMASRDPFISSEAPKTLLTDDHETSGIVSGDIVKRYLAWIVQLIKDDLSVGGISIGDTPRQSIALINGIDFHVGDPIP